MKLHIFVPSILQYLLTYRDIGTPNLSTIIPHYFFLPSFVSCSFILSWLITNVSFLFCPYKFLYARGPNYILELHSVLCWLSVLTFHHSKLSIRSISSWFSFFTVYQFLTVMPHFGLLHNLIWLFCTLLGFFFLSFWISHFFMPI